MTRFARTTDPDTSHEAARKLNTRTQKDMLMRAYHKAGEYGLTDEEAGVVARLYRTGSCHWHRSSDLAREGRIVNTPIRRMNRSGRSGMVRVYNPHNSTNKVMFS